MARKKNRRRERRHVLDVKLASNQVQRRRVQLAVSAVVATLFLVGTVYGLWRGGWWAVQRFVYQNEHLQVRHFEVRTDGVIKEEHIRRWAGVKLGANLFEIDLHAIKRQLEMQGMIRLASLERVLPDTLKLQVNERVPVARMRVRFSGPDGRSTAREFGVDLTGRVMPLDSTVVRPETSLAWLRLPLLAGVPVREIAAGRDLTDPQIQAAIRFLREFQHASIRTQLQLAGVDVTPRETLRVSTVQGPVVEVLSSTPGGFARQLARWQAIHSEQVRRQEPYTFINLATTNHVPVTLAVVPASGTANPAPTN
ncbi:MAG TPA: hypothetical protein DCY13_23320 [Verrucomicrobiales bacterium]|nr:hypothetical protein [Verrucomicrobiales bacterium]